MKAHIVHSRINIEVDHIL